MKTLLLDAALLCAAPALAHELPHMPAGPMPAPYAMPYPGPSHALPGLFGDGPLVNTVIGIGVQTNAQTGQGNCATNVLDLGQIDAGSPGGGLVNTALGLSVQTNAQTGQGNGAFNGLGMNQRLPGLMPAPPVR
jgi:hypothetical protein